MTIQAQQAYSAAAYQAKLMHNLVEGHEYLHDLPGSCGGGAPYFEDNHHQHRGDGSSVVEGYLSYPPIMSEYPPAPHTDTAGGVVDGNHCESDATAAVAAAVQHQQHYRQQCLDEGRAEGQQQHQHHHHHNNNHEEQHYQQHHTYHHNDEHHQQQQHQLHHHNLTYHQHQHHHHDESSAQYHDAVSVNNLHNDQQQHLSHHMPPPPPHHHHHQQLPTDQNSVADPSARINVVAGSNSLQFPTPAPTRGGTPGSFGGGAAYSIDNLVHLPPTGPSEHQFTLPLTYEVENNTSPDSPATSFPMTYYPPQAYAAQTTSEANNYASYEPAAFEGVQHHNQPQHDQQLDQHQLQHQKVAPVKPKRKYSSAKKEQQLAAIPESHLAFGEDCESERKRRNQVKVACIHCKRACKKCDDVRPCGRCVRIGQADTCEDAPRKERSKGKSRGPYNKKRDGSEKHSPEEYHQESGTRGGHLSVIKDEPRSLHEHQHYLLSHPIEDAEYGSENSVALAAAALAAATGFIDEKQHPDGPTQHFYAGDDLHHQHEQESQHLLDNSHLQHGHHSQYPSQQQGQQQQRHHLLHNQQQQKQQQQIISTDEEHRFINEFDPYTAGGHHNNRYLETPAFYYFHQDQNPQASSLHPHHAPSGMVGVPPDTPAESISDVGRSSSMHSISSVISGDDRLISSQHVY